MSIVKMKRLRLIGLNGDRDVLLQRLMRLGCIELTEIPEGSETAALMERQGSNLPEARTSLTRLNQAMAILQRYAPEKSGLFAAREEISADDLFAGDEIGPVLEVASTIILKEDKISRLHARVSQMESNRTALSLWQGLDVPLETRGTEQAAVLFGMLPAGADLDELERTLGERAEAACLFRAGSGKEAHCFMVVCHRDCTDAVTEVLREFGYTQVVFSETGTAKENIARIGADLDTANREIQRYKGEIAALADRRRELKLCADRVAQEIAREEAKEKLMVSGSIFAMEGWLSAPEEERVEALLDEYSCAYELADPEPEEISANKVPVKLKGNRLTEPLNMVTDMYTYPAYDGIDPNGLITPFFCLFFGIMYADLGYGLILLALGLLSKWKLKMRGTMKYAEGLLILCGVTTAVFGFLFGGFFGDLIPTFSETFLGREVELWALIDPLQNPMPIMIAALVLGGIHLITGMIVRIYMGFRDGEPMEGILDVLPWWTLFAGIALLALGQGIWLTLVGVAFLICTQGRHSPTIGGKLMGGLASLYDITSYLSDVLSYIRLMALLLATSVIASVFNILAALPGNVIVFIIIFLIGHGFNMAINIIGTYVHAARLQYLEFFGKFYKEGGSRFNPLRIVTKYHDVTEN